MTFIRSVKQGFGRGLGILCAIALFFIWSAVCYHVGYNAAIDSIFSVYPTPQRGYTWPTPESL